MEMLQITTDVKETVFPLNQMVIVTSILNQTNVRFVVKDFEKILRHVTMGIKETIKDVLLIVNQSFLDGLVQEDPQLPLTFAKNVEMRFLKELKFVMTTILLQVTDVIQDAIKKQALIVLELQDLAYQSVLMAC